jgi:ribosomal protein S20
VEIDASTMSDTILLGVLNPMSNKQKRQQLATSVKPTVDALTQENLDGTQAPKAETVKPIYVKVEPKVVETAKATAEVSRETQPAAETVKKVTKTRTVSPLPNGRLTPRQRVIAVVHFAEALKAESVEPKDVNKRMLEVAAELVGQTTADMPALVTKHFNESASQKGWDHFIRDIRVEMAVPGTWTIVEPKAAQPKQAKETIPAEVIELAKQILAKRAAEVALAAEQSIQGS